MSASIKPLQNQFRLYPLTELNCSKRDFKPRRGIDLGPSTELLSLQGIKGEMESLVKTIISINAIVWQAGAVEEQIVHI